MLAILPMAIGLRSTDCGPVSCGDLQTYGKAAAAFGVVAAMLVLVARSVVARRYDAAGLAFFLLVPAAIWLFMILQGDTAEIEQLSAAARQYAIDRQFTSDPRTLVLDGKEGWAAVRVTAPDSSSQVVLLRKIEGQWRARTMAPTWGREDLRAQGAPVDLIR